MSNALREKLKVKSPEEAIPYLNLLVYGDPGAGKTYLAGTALDHKLTKPVLFIDVEGGVTTLRKRKDLDVIQVRSIKEVIDINNEIIKAGDPYYKTIVLDSLTELQKMDMAWVQEFEYNKLGPEKVDKDIPSQRAWGKSGERMRRIITAYRDLPTHLIATCRLGQEYDDSTGITHFYPALPGKLRADVPGYFDVVGFLKADSKKQGNDTVTIRTLQVGKTARVVAKDRTDSLPLVIEGPNIPDMWNVIHGSNANG